MSFPGCWSDEAWIARELVPMVWRIASRVARDHGLDAEDRDDLAQGILARVLTARPDIHTSLGGFIGVVAKNLATDKFRGPRRHELPVGLGLCVREPNSSGNEAPSSDPGPEDAVVGSASRSAVEPVLLRIAALPASAAGTDAEDAALVGHAAADVVVVLEADGSLCRGELLRTTKRSLRALTAKVLARRGLRSDHLAHAIDRLQPTVCVALVERLDQLRASPRAMAVGVLVHDETEEKRRAQLSSDRIRQARNRAVDGLMSRISVPVPASWVTDLDPTARADAIEVFVRDLVLTQTIDLGSAEAAKAVARGLKWIAKRLPSQAAELAIVLRRRARRLERSH